MRKRWIVLLSLTVIAGLLATAGTAAEKEKKKKSRVVLPAAARGFAGMIEGKVVAAKGTKIVLAVEKIANVWQHSKAENPESLVGQKVVVVCRMEEGKPAGNLVRFIATLKAGETTKLDVRNDKGNRLVLLELTAEQRERIAEKE